MLFEDLDLALGPGEAAAGHRPERQRQIEPDPARRRTACEQNGGTSSASALALADDHLALDRELPLRRALALLGRRRSTEAMDALGIDQLAEVPVRLLSSGQVKRATLARVAASRAPLWLLDEPLNALDADGRERLGGTGRAASRRRAVRCSPPRISRLRGDWRRLELGR